MKEWEVVDFQSGSLLLCIKFYFPYLNGSLISTNNKVNQVIDSLLINSTRYLINCTLQCKSYQVSVAKYLIVLQAYKKVP